MRLLKTVLAIFLFSNTFLSTAQNTQPEHTIHIGTFINPKPDDFKHIRSLGFLYSRTQPNNYSDIMMGGYMDAESARAVVEQLKNQGYHSPYVTNLNLKEGNNVAVIQLGIKNVQKEIDWSRYFKLDKLYVIIQQNTLKIVTGIYPDIAAAKADLSNVRAKGFSDAFPKSVNNALLHEITTFETGGAKRALIPLDFSDAQAKNSNKGSKEEMTPKGYEEETILPKGANIKTESKSKSNSISNAVKIPDIRADLKRTSALELQKVMKELKVYNSFLDGYYGKGTRIAYKKAASQNRQLKKYRLLAKAQEFGTADEQPEGLQYFINNLWDETAAALGGLESSNAPIAKAYRAYYSFNTSGISQEVNNLMNTAIRAAFAGKKLENFPRFDYNATYAYTDLDQLLLHLRYIHEVSVDKPAAPCWLFKRHPGAALRAFDASERNADFRVQNCGGFWEWENIQVLHAIALDLCAQNDIDSEEMAKDHSDLSRLFLTPKTLSAAEQKALTTWNKNLLSGIAGWSFKDPMLKEISVAFKLSYFQTQVLLEDHFMDGGFKEKEAKGMALAVLKVLVGHHLERFV